ncbi:MAG: hypothetical protein HXX11_04615 [Desulfuromonadales bacterium]|nr:hypothetical protein [Desulfuromonadales bacterium]
MLKRLHLKLLNRLQLRESWVIFFILGIILINFPFLHIFNKSDIIVGFPLLFIYLFAGWIISIFIIYLFTLAIGKNEVKHTERRQP